MRKLRNDEIPRLRPEELGRIAPHPVSVLVDNVRSLYNVGSIFRTSDAARIEHLYLTGITPTPDHPGLQKTALGAQDTVRWSAVSNPVDVIERLRRQGYTIAALEITDAPTAIADLATHHFPLCLILGHEVHGVSDDLLALSDLALEIPQYGTKQSLNVAVAYGIAVYGIVERYRTLHAGS
ncbi:MAG: TrmH family RNA methyltransferase [Bacteroidetes bacterium]|nr:MAG: TrmH family RNA methyltransferase [Bacteroidota bacterium]